MKKSPLNPLHERMGARMVQADGWSMPHTYSNLLEEHLAARSACAVFDVSHMAKFRIRGNGAMDWLESTLSGKVSECRDSTGLRTLLQDDEGRIIDRMMLLRESAGNFLLLGHASREVEDAEWLQAHKPHAALELQNETNAWCAMVLMGPQSEQVITRVLRGAELPMPGGFCRFFYQNHELILGRLGLEEETEQERAYEFFCPAVAGISWFESFMGAGAQPCGSATRECLRLERGCVAVGHEITRRSRPGEVGLSHLCHGKREGHGLTPPREKVARLRCSGGGRTTPDPGSSVRDSAGNTVGRVTSAAFSPSVDDVVVMALVYAPLVHPGVQLHVMVQGRPVVATVL